VAILALFFLFFSIFGDSKKQGICDRSFFFQNISRKMAKIRHQKNRCCQGSSSMVRSLLLNIGWPSFGLQTNFYVPEVIFIMVLQERGRVFGVGFPLHTASDSSEIRFHVVVSASGKCLKSSRLSEVFDQMQKWSELGNN
jgi:hypothetical protein